MSDKTKVTKKGEPSAKAMAPSSLDDKIKDREACYIKSPRRVQAVDDLSRFSQIEQKQRTQPVP